MRSEVLLALLVLSLAGPARAEPRAEYQFSHNAKLAGRAEACGDRAGAAGIRSASKQLVPLLAGQPDFAAQMKAFDKRAKQQRKMTERASGKRAVCERIADEIFDNLHSTRVITAPPRLTPAPAPEAAIEN